MMRVLKNVFVAAAGYLAGRMAAGRRRAVRPEPTGKSIVPKGRFDVKRLLIRLAALLPVLAVIGFLVAASGIIPIKASSGHWAVTEWFLQFSKSRSVATHSLGIETPPLDDPWLVLKGAGHFETGCLPCHGGPGREHPRIARRMTPLPPLLTFTIPDRKPRELFYIVKHGIKLTGMPAWPALSRDDEVWAVVAFLRALPDMEAEEYERLVYGEGNDQEEEAVNAEAAPDLAGAADVDTTLAASAPLQGLLYPEEIPPAVSDRCGRCHGADGAGRGLPAFPRLAGQRPQYLFAALRAYADGERHSGIMQPVAAGLGEDEMRTIANFYSRLATDPTPPASDSDAAAVERGERIAREGIPRERVPACTGCHGPDAQPKNPFYPILAGQFAEYVMLQLELFKDERRGGSAYAHLMHPTAEDLTEEQIRDVALYYGSLGTELTETGSTPADTTRSIDLP